MAVNGYKILLIHPPKIARKGVMDYLRYPPLGIVTLASVLRKEGVKPFIYDANIEKGDHLEKISKLIQDENINAIGLSFTTILTRGAYFIAGELKRKFPEIPIIAGGYHPTVMSDEVIGCGHIDYAVLGEGEITLPLLLDAIQNGVEPDNVEGLCFKRKGEIIHTGCRPLIGNIDTIPIPAYDLLSLNSYSSLSSTRKPFVTVVRSRGCPFRCVFCGVDAIFSRRYRCQSPERTLEEVLFLVKRFGVREILFKDSDFLINRKNVEELCNLFLKERLDLLWSCNARVDSVNKDILGLMKRAGCSQISFGIESGSQRMLDALRKDFTAGQVIEAIRLAKEQGIACVGDFIIGAPGEDYETIDETVKLIQKLPLDYASFHFLTAFPGSPLYKLAFENKWLIDGRGPGGYEDMNINASRLSDIELKKAMDCMVRSFYFRPSYIFNRLTRITPGEIRNNLIGGVGLLGKLFRK